ncbi:MAG: hypothetical protein QE484_16110 [Rhizobium sp.]|nr:hypothetical protein [Rhizobium sp.]
MRAFLSLLAATGLIVAAQPALADTLSFTIDNQTPNMIVQFYATPADGGTRSELLKKKGLYGGQSRKLIIADGSDACVYKIRAVFEDDSFYDVRDEVDFCESDSYTIAD